MQDIEKQIYTFLEQPLSPNVLQSLLEVVEVAGVLKGGIMLSSRPEIIHEATMLFEMLYEAALKNIYLSYTDAILEIYGENSDSFIYKHFQAVQACRSYANSKLALWGILPATDIVKINECIVCQDATLINDNAPMELYKEFSDQINAFMERIHDSQHHPYIHIVVILLISKAMNSYYALHPQTLEILYSSLFYPKSPSSLPLYLAKHQLFYGFKIGNDFVIDDYVFGFLLYIKNEMLNMTKLIKGLDIGIEGLASRLNDDCNLKHIDALNNLLQSHLCFRNETLAEDLNVSDKTSIEYMKRLESYGLVTGYKCGRKKLYINNHLLPIILEANHNGS